MDFNRKQDFVKVHLFVCDPVGIQTQDLQNRNLTLYSAKLRDRFLKTDAKVRQKSEKWEVKSEKFWELKSFKD